MDVERVVQAPPELMARREYQAEAVGTGTVDGKPVRVVLATLQTPYLGVVVRWLKIQAHRIADGLDPAPDVPWLESERRALVTGQHLDQAHSAPAELRAWCADESGRQLAFDRLRHGQPFTLGAADHTGTYCLWVVPVDVPNDEPPTRTPEGPPTHVHRHRKPRPLLQWLLHRKHTDAEPHSSVREVNCNGAH